MNESEYISLAVKNLVPEAEFTFTENDITTIKSLNDVKLPTSSSILKEVERVKAEEINKAAADAIAKTALLERLGITEEEAQLLLGGN